MEVLIAAGVTAIGLFGVLSIIPLAAMQVGKGVTEDRKAVLGKTGASEFHVRGYRRPENWIFGDGTPVWNPAQYPSTPYAPSGVSFCIDPRFMTANAGNQSFPYTTAFPAAIPAVARVLMPRITLRATPFDPTNSGVLLPMNAQMADEIFRSQDDLEFLIPTGDRTQPAVQQLVSSGAKRQSTGNYSWMAMLVPKHGAASDEYVLSVVIFNKRDQTFDTTRTVVAGMTAKQVADVNERVVTVSAFSGQGVGGGEVQLLAATREELDAIPENSWLMLAGQTRTYDPLPSTAAADAPYFPTTDFKWYRVLATDDVVGAGPFTRSITLQGSDWQRPEWTGVVTPTQATIMSGVVGVFEKTMRIETTSLWTN